MIDRDYTKVRCRSSPESRTQPADLRARARLAFPPLTRQFPFDGMKKLRWVQAGRQVDKQTDRQTGKQVVGDGDDDNDRGLGLDDDYGGGHINRHYLWHYF